jgi:hypothetical protein
MSGAQAAAVTLDGADTVAVKMASEFSLQNSGPFRNSEGATAPGKDLLKVIVPALNGYTADSSNSYFVKIALLDGATFNGTPVMTCKDNTPADVDLPITQNGTVGSNIATFSLAVGETLGADTCTLTVKGGDATVASMTGYYNITDKQNQRMSAVIEFQNGLSDAASGTVGTFISFVTALELVASPRSVSDKTAAEAIISVQDASLKFDSNTVPGVNTAFIGSVTYKAAESLAGAEVYGPKQATNVAAADILATASITVNSPALAGINTVTLTDGTKDVCTNIKSSMQPQGATSVTFTNLQPADLSAGFNICIVADGVTNIPAGLFSVTVTGAGVTSGTPATEVASPDFGASDRPLYNLVKNGSSYRVLNIPPVGVADQAFIRLYNVSNFEGTVLGEMRNTAGELIGNQSTVVTTLGPREVKVINADTLKTLFADWTGRSRLFLESDISELRVQSLLRSSNVLENMSGQAAD